MQVKPSYIPKAPRAKHPPKRDKVVGLLAEYGIPANKADSLLAVFSRMTYMQGRCRSLASRDFKRIENAIAKLKTIAEGFDLVPHPEEDYESLNYLLCRAETYAETRSNDWQTDALWRLADWWRENTHTPYRKTIKQGTKQSPSIDFTLKALELWGERIQPNTLRDWIGRARLK